MKDNNLKHVGKLGQSIWIDYIRRDLIASGELKRLIKEDGLRGMTSNPSIFEKAIVESHDYDSDIRVMTSEGKTCSAIYEALSQHDVQSAADEFRQLYDETDGKDGYVSLEVNPHLAHDLSGTLAEARRLWAALNRPNIFIKVPATDEGVKAIQQLISEGININVTLIFGLSRYRQIAKAYISGIEARAEQGESIKRVASVASFFVSRIDALVDPQLNEIIIKGKDMGQLAKELFGQVAIASARIAYQDYKEIFNSDRFKKLTERAARPQRLLWASVGIKDPSFSDVKYIEALIGPGTVSTVPMDTLNAYQDHGEPEARLGRDVGKAQWMLERLPELDISLENVTRQLEDEGIEKFNKPFDKLMETLAKMSTLNGDVYIGKRKTN